MTEEMTHELHQGNALHILPTLEAGTVQTCVTSPPYWGLRDYGDPGQEWPAVEFRLALGGLDAPVSVPAMTAALGLEPTPIAYVAHMVAIVREVRRTLTEDGTLWLNVGDSYAASGAVAYGKSAQSTLMSSGLKNTQPGSGKGATPAIGMKPKDLVGIPWLLAFALRSDGWYLRSDIIWHKRNPMPEPVTDRPTKGHEYLFLLAKSARYHCDMSAVREDDSAHLKDTIPVTISEILYPAHSGSGKSARSPNSSAILRCQAQGPGEVFAAPREPRRKMCGFLAVMSAAGDQHVGPCGAECIAGVRARGTGSCDAEFGVSLEFDFFYGVVVVRFLQSIECDAKGGGQLRGARIASLHRGLVCGIGDLINVGGLLHDVGCEVAGGIGGSHSRCPWSWFLLAL